jgi:hypothetical protein
MSEDDVRYVIWNVRMLGKRAFLPCQISIYVLVNSILAKPIEHFYFEEFRQQAIVSL